MADAIVFTLPEVPDPEHRDAHWWLIAGGQLVEMGEGDEWIGFALGEGRKRIALAPAASVRIAIADRPEAASDRQAASIARIAAVEASLGEPEALHSVSALLDGSVKTAIVDNGAMLAWIDWAREAGADPHHIIPVGALLPLGDDWASAVFGTERVMGRAGTVLPFEPALAGELARGAEPRELEQDEVEAMIVAATEQPPIDLRVGRMARRRRIVIDGRRIRELALIAGSIPLIVLAYALVGIVKLDSATDRLNAETLAVAERALGRQVTLETAESELAQQVGGSGQGGVMAPLGGLYSALQGEQSVSSTSLSYGADGTLSTTLAAPTVDAVNRVLVAVQRNGYRITAVPRQAPDGRSMVDVTVRSRP